MFVSETWEKPNDSYDIRGFDKISVPRLLNMSSNSKRGHGGICLYYKPHVKKYFVVEKTINSGFIWIKIHKTILKTYQDLYVCFCYIPPSNSPYFINNEIEFFDCLEENVCHFSNIGSVTIMGDLNARCGEKTDCLQQDCDYTEFIPSVTSESSGLFLLRHRSSMDKTVNASGNKLLDLCTSSKLKIVNGRVFDDSGVGSFTYMSVNGHSLIDYVVCSEELFPCISNFVVHDIQSHSHHTPIQINFSTNNTRTIITNKTLMYDKLIWNQDNGAMYKAHIANIVGELEELTTNITNENITIDTGIEQFSSALYNTSFRIFGKQITVNIDKTYTKKRNIWLNKECYEAKKKF